jgi:RNA polymerase-binding transcription factor DksA
MTIEEAIFTIENRDGIMDYGETEQLGEALDIAIAALEKEIPKPISIENGFVKCGNCGKYIRFPIADRYNHCPECGQAIQWLDMSRFEKANKIVVPKIEYKQGVNEE